MWISDLLLIADLVGQSCSSLVETALSWGDDRGSWCGMVDCRRAKVLLFGADSADSVYIRRREGFEDLFWLSADDN